MYNQVIKRSHWCKMKFDYNDEFSFKFIGHEILV